MSYSGAGPRWGLADGGWGDQLPRDSFSHRDGADFLGAVRQDCTRTDLDPGLRPDGLDERPHDLFGHELISRAPGEAASKVEVNVPTGVFDEKELALI